MSISRISPETRRIFDPKTTLPASRSPHATRRQRVGQQKDADPHPAAYPSRKGTTYRLLKHAQTAASGCAVRTRFARKMRIARPTATDCACLPTPTTLLPQTHSLPVRRRPFSYPPPWSQPCGGDQPLQPRIHSKTQPTYSNGLLLATPLTPSALS